MRHKGFLARVMAAVFAVSAITASAATADVPEGATVEQAKFTPSPQAPASGPGVAGSSCWEPFCSKTDNESHLGVFVARDWLCGGTTGSTGGESCVTSDPAKRRWIYTGQRTPSGQDWDSFRVDAGYCYKVRFSLPYDAWIHYYNRSGLGAIWVKVEDHAIAFVQAQRYGSCP